MELGLDADTVVKFVALLRKCNVCTMGALRAFHDNLDTLVTSMFEDEDTPMAKMQAAGFLATLRVRACARLARHEVPASHPHAAPPASPQDEAELPVPGSTVVPLSSARGRGRGGSSSSVSARSISDTGGTSSTMRVNGPSVNASTLKLPSHLLAEARRLAASASKDNPITEPTARPLVHSTAIWLMRLGVISKSEHPGVIDEAGSQLHKIIPLDHMRGAKGGRPTTFSHRIDVYLGNHVRFESGSCRVEVRHDETLNTPMKALDDAGFVKRVDSPTQGHSGLSILGKGRERMPGPLSDPIGFPNGGRPLDEESSTFSGLPASAPPASAPPATTPAAAAPTAAAPSAGSGDQISIASLLSTLASRAGLDVVVNHSGRGPPTPFPIDADPRGADPNGADPNGADPNGADPNGADPNGAGPNGADPNGADPNGADPNGSGRSRGGRGRSRGGRGRGANPDAREKNPDARGKKRSVGEVERSPVSHVAFETSEAAREFEIVQDALAKGSTAAFPMALPDKEEAWYVGTVVRMCKPYWADVSFPDGKLWMKSNAAERGVEWHVVRKRASV